MTQQNTHKGSAGNKLDAGEICKEKNFLWGKLFGLRVQGGDPTAQGRTLGHT